MITDAGNEIDFYNFSVFNDENDIKYFFDNDFFNCFILSDLCIAYLYSGIIVDTYRTNEWYIHFLHQV